MAGRRAHAARKALTACPRCGGAGRTVGPETLQAVLKPEATLRILAFKPRFCRSRGCDVLYYGADGRVVEKQGATVPVGIKETEDLALLCNCLGITRSDIRHDVEETGSSRARETEPCRSEPQPKRTEVAVNAAHPRPRGRSAPRPLIWRLSMNSTDLAERLSASFPPTDGISTLFPVLLRALAKGRPVSPPALAAALGWSPEKVREVLEQVPSIEFDDAGNVVGAGLTLRETPHLFEVEGQRLHTWCALDALMFPALIGKTARVSSPCAATGAPIRLTVTSDGVRDLEPPEAVVSLVLPDTTSDVRSSFCVRVNFFASAAAAQTWLSAHPGATVARVEDAFQLGQELARRLFAGKAGACC